MKTDFNAKTPRRRGAKPEAEVDLTREASPLVAPVASVLWFLFPQNPRAFASLRLCVKKVIGGQNVLTNPITGPQQFYRLSQ